MAKINKDNTFLKLRDINIVFRSKGKKFNAVKETTLDIQKGEIFGLVGESGSGKTTIARAVVGVQPLQDGAIYMGNNLIAGKPSSLYTLNKEILNKLFSMKKKMDLTTGYLHEFIVTLKKIYELNPEFSDLTIQDLLKKIKLSRVEFIDDVFLSNLKYINKIILNQERIMRFVDNISTQIPSIPQELEEAIIFKQEQGNKIVLELKDALDEIYMIAHPLVKLRKMLKLDDVEVKTLFIKIFKKLDVIVKNHKQFLAKIDEAIEVQQESQLLAAPSSIKDKMITKYYEKVYVFRDDFIAECKNQLLNLTKVEGYETNQTYILLKKYIRDFWSKNNINLKGCQKIIDHLKLENINWSLLENISLKLKKTDFENDLKEIIESKKIDSAKVLELEKQLKYIKKIVKRNVVKDQDTINDYYKFKNIEITIEPEQEKYFKQFTEFLELPSIDKLIKKSFMFKKQSKAQRKENRRNVQMIFQDPGSSLNDRMAVEEIIGEGLNNFPELYKSLEAKEEYLRDYNQNNPDMQKTIKEVKDADVKKFLILKSLTSVGLIPEHLSRYPHEFSGGQRQRIGIARSLIMKPQLIVADEPISALDVSIRAQVLNIFKKFKEELGITFIFVAHDLSVVRFIADKIAVIYHGQIVEMAEADELFINPLHPYTKSLLTAIPVPEPTLAKTRINTVYKPEEEHHDYLFDLPKFVEVKKDHYVFLNSRELKEMKKLLNK